MKTIAIIVYCIVVISLMGIIYKNSAIEKQDNKNICFRSAKQFEIFQPIEALGGKNSSKMSGSIHGDFFLIIGGGSGSINSDNFYLLNYAVKDQYGLQIRSESVDSATRIKEIDTGRPGIRTIYRRTYSEEECKTYKIARIFEVPKGTIQNQYNVNLSN